MPRDDLFRSQRPDLVDFNFTEEVAQVFPDMIRRSIPGYGFVVSTSAWLAVDHLQQRAPQRPPVVYDLGCALGATTLAFLKHWGEAPCTLHAVDASGPMIARARAAHGQDPRIHWHHERLEQVAYGKADVVFLNYVLQFLPPEARLHELQRIREALAPGGVLLLSEKIRTDATEEEAFRVGTHHRFKRANGYSDLEIQQKRDALERVMRIDTEALHHNRLRDAGFSTVHTWNRCLNWAAFLASP